MESIWTRDVQMPRFPSLDGDVHTDVLVVGGGLAGLLCAYYLQKEGLDCLVAEGCRVGCGVTLGTTAKVTAQHGLIGTGLLRNLGQDRARLYVQANLEAAGEYRRLCDELGCGFEDADSFVYSLTDRELLDQELAALRRLGCPAEFQKTLELPFSVAGAVKVPHQGKLHPLQFLAGLAQRLNILEDTWVRDVGELKDGARSARTDRGTIQAKRVVIATHFPFLDRWGGYFMKLYQDRSYVLALENAPLPVGMYRDADDKGLSFRTAGKYLLLGGGSGRTGKPSLGWRPLQETARRYWPNAKVTAFWAAQDCITPDGVPYAGQYGKETGGLYVLTGFQKWGFTNAMVGAKILAAMLTGREHPAQGVYSPQRKLPLPALAVNGMEAAADFALPLPKRCPHMGCALRWNRAEHTWDCPCHGSRFTRKGEVLDGPAQRNLIP